MKQKSAPQGCALGAKAYSFSCQLKIPPIMPPAAQQARTGSILVKSGTLTVAQQDRRCKESQKI